MRNGLSSLFFLNLIATVLLVVLAEPIVRLLFQYGDHFTTDSTLRVSFALKCLAPGLVAFSTVNILARAFYALGDTKTPMQISVLCLVINFIAACLLIVPMREGGPGIANTFTSLINVGLLFFALKKKLKKLEMAAVRLALLQLCWMGLIAGIIAWMSWQIWEEHLGHATIPLRFGAVFVPATLAGLIYLALALVAENSRGAGNDRIRFRQIQAVQEIKANRCRLSWLRFVPPFLLSVFICVHLWLKMIFINPPPSRSSYSPQTARETSPPPPLLPPDSP